jgi:hypothetical protein
MDDVTRQAAQLAIQTPTFLALGVGMIVAVFHLVTGRATISALLVLIGFAGMAATQTFWIAMDLAFTAELLDYTFYESWASTAVNVLIVALDAVFLTMSLAAVFVGRLGVQP